MSLSTRHDNFPRVPEIYSGSAQKHCQQSYLRNTQYQPPAQVKFLTIVLRTSRTCVCVFRECREFREFVYVALGLVEEPGHAQSQCVRTKAWPTGRGARAIQTVPDRRSEEIQHKSGREISSFQNCTSFKTISVEHKNKNFNPN